MGRDTGDLLCEVSEWELDSSSPVCLNLLVIALAFGYVPQPHGGDLTDFFPPLSGQASPSVLGGTAAPPRPPPFASSHGDSSSKAEH